MHSEYHLAFDGSTDNITLFIIEKGVRYSETEGIVVLIYNTGVVAM